MTLPTSTRSRSDERDARGPEFVNPVRADTTVVDSRLLFEIVIPQSAEVLGTYQADFYAGTPRHPEDNSRSSHDRGGLC